MDWRSIRIVEFADWLVQMPATSGMVLSDRSIREFMGQFNDGKFFGVKYTDETTFNDIISTFPHEYNHEGLFVVDRHHWKMRIIRSIGEFITLFTAEKN